MTSVRVFFARLLASFRGERLEREISEEIETHLDLLTEEHLERGLSLEDARDAARRSFGTVERVKEAHREQRAFSAGLDSFLSDLRCALRRIVKEPGLAAAAVVTLAFAIGANNAVFTIVNVMVLRGLPVSHPEEMMALGTRDAAGRERGASYLEYLDWRAASTTFAGLAACRNESMTILEERRTADRFRGCYLSENAFPLLGEEPVWGRGFSEEDGREGTAPVVILSHDVWTARYDRDPDVLGRQVRVNGVPATIVGVMRRGMKFPDFAEVWLPLASSPGLSASPRDDRSLRVFGRLARGTPRSEAQAELEALGERLAADHPETDADFRPTVSPYARGLERLPLFQALLGAIGFVLVLACANVASLLLVRSTERSREIAIQVSLGCPRARIVRQTLVECALLGLLGGGLGFALSLVAVRLFANDVRTINLPYWFQWTMDGRVAAFLVCVCLASVVLVGLAPALQASRTSADAILKGGGRAGKRSRAYLRWVVAFELASTLVLLSGAGLMMKTFVEVYHADLVIATTHLQTAQLALPQSRYPTASVRAAFYERLEERLDGVAAVSSATLATSLPFTGAPVSPVTLEGAEPVSGSAGGGASVVEVAFDYFDTLQLPLVLGRPFDEADGSDRIVVNERFVEMYLEGEDPLGRRIRVGDDDALLTIVGVSSTLRQSYLRDLDPVVYRPYLTDPKPSLHVILRSPSVPEAVTPLLRSEVASLDPEVPVYAVHTMDYLKEQSRWGHRVFGFLFTVFGAIALLLCAVGLYGVLAYSVTQMRREIGIRMTLGATAGRVLWLVGRSVLAQVLLGAAAGAAGAVVLGKLLKAVLVQTTATEPAVFLGAGLLLASVLCLAGYLPTRRATRMDPAEVLRSE